MTYFATACSSGKLKRCINDMVTTRVQTLPKSCCSVKVAGPIVRINPREIHIKDPDFYDEVYASGSRKREKDPHFIPALLSPHSIISTIDHEHHRLRKSYLKNFFSRRSLKTLEPFVQQSINLLCQKLERAYAEKQPVQLDSLYADLTADLITYYSFGESSGYLNREGKVNDIQSGVGTITNGFHLNRFFPMFRQTVLMCPIWAIKTFFPNYAETLEMLRLLHEQSKAALAKTEFKYSDRDRTLFDALADPEIPSKERTTARLMDEGFVVLAAGTATTARTLAMASFHMFSQKRILHKMREEVQEIMHRTDKNPCWADLEGLPYLV